jgi:carbon storage regulator CsrA
MLVLSRKTGQSVHLSTGTPGECIVLKVIDLGGGRVRLGIEAPTNVSIVRAELGPIEARRRAPASPVRSACSIANVA